MTEEGEKNADANVIFGTYIDKDSSVKPDGIKKMLKVWISFCLTVAALQATPYHEVPLRVRLTSI